MYLPPAIILLGITLLVGAIAWVIRKLVPLEYLRHHHEVAFPIFLQIGVIYAVLLAFLFSLEWGNYKSALEDIEHEATTLVVLMHLTQGIPAPEHKRIEQQILDYTQSIIHYDWPRMAHESESKQAGGALYSIWHSYLNLTQVPSTAEQQAIFQAALANLQKLSEYRQLRLFLSVQEQPTKIWIVLICMGAVVVCISFMFGMRYIWSQTSLIAALACMITIIILLIIIMSTPLSGSYPLKPKPFEEAFTKMQLLIEYESASSLAIKK